MKINLSHLSRDESVQQAMNIAFSTGMQHGWFRGAFFGVLMGIVLGTCGWLLHG